MQFIFTFSFLEILESFSVIEIYIKMSEILNFCFFTLISQIPPYLMFTLVSKSTHPVSLVLSSQNAQSMVLHIRSTNACLHAVASYNYVA